MYVNLSLDLNPSSCLPHPTNTYIYKVTTAPKGDLTLLKS